MTANHKCDKCGIISSYFGTGKDGGYLCRDCYEQEQLLCRHGNKKYICLLCHMEYEKEKHGDNTVFIEQSNREIAFKKKVSKRRAKNKNKKTHRK